MFTLDLSEKLGISQSGVIELAIRRLAEIEGIKHEQESSN